MASREPKDTGIDPVDAWMRRQQNPDLPFVAQAYMMDADRVIDCSAQCVNQALMEELEDLHREEWNITIPHAVDLVYRYDGFSPILSVRFLVHLEIVKVEEKERP